MALTYSNVRQLVINNKRGVECLVTFDSSYPTGGEPVDLAALGLKQVDSVQVVTELQTDAGAGTTITAILTNPTAPLLELMTAANTEAANGSNQSAVAATCRFLGS